MGPGARDPWGATRAGQQARFAELSVTTASLALSASIFADAGVVLRDGAIPAGSRFATRWTFTFSDLW